MLWREKLIVALDTSNEKHAIEVVDALNEYVQIFKVGFELFVTSGPAIIQKIHDRNKKVFLDLKFHDIPNTVSKAAIVVARLGVYMFNLHASGGLEMMRRCRESVLEVCVKENRKTPMILGVTALTSLDNEILRQELGVHHSIKTHVKHLSVLALRAGLDGVVASTHEIGMIKHECGKGFLVVTPGIRPSWVPPDDQRRTATPREALRGGADYIVMGRGILKQDDPIKALELISLEMLTAK